MDRHDLSRKIQNCLLNEIIVTRRYKLLLKAVQILEMAGYICSIIITGTTLKDVIKWKCPSQQLPNGRQVITLPPNETVLLVREKDTFSKIISTETTCSQRLSYLLSQFSTERLTVQTGSKATGVNENHTSKGPDCEGPEQLHKLQPRAM